MIERKGTAIAVLFGVLLILLFLSGCRKVEASNQRMREETHGSYFHIYTDLETGVQYLRVESGGVCVMVDKDGKPYLANGWRDYD